MKWIIGGLALAAIGCGPTEQLTRAGGDVSEEKPAKSQRANGLYSDALNAELVATNLNLSGIVGVEASAAGERVYLSMGQFSCSITETGAMDYDVDVDPGGGSVDSGGTGDTGSTGVIDTGEEDVIGTGDGELMLIASVDALYRVDAPNGHQHRMAIPGAVAAAERGGQLTVLDVRERVQRFDVGDNGHPTLRWAVQLDQTSGQMSVRGHDVFVAGTPVRHVDGVGVVQELGMSADQVLAEMSGDLFLRSGDRIEVFGPDLVLRWGLEDGHVSDIGAVPGRDLLWAHYPLRNGENQVVLFDRLTGDVRGEFVVKDARHVAVSADGDTVAFATQRGVRMYRFED